MGADRIRRRRLRFLAPVAVLGAIGLAAWLPTVAAGASTPDLVALTPQQIVAKALDVQVPGFSGSLRWSADLGIPDLGSVVGGVGGGGGSFDPSVLLSGSHTIKVWVAGADRQRLALAESLSEVDFVHNGQRAWYYDSSTNTVTDLVVAGGSARHSATRGDQVSGPAVTPGEIAAELLSHLTSTTTVSATSSVFVAGRASYQLVLAPRARTTEASESTIRQIAIAVDATTGMPLRVQVDVKGQSEPALEIGFRSVSFAVPSPSEFRPLSGNRAETKTVAGPHTWGPAPVSRHGFNLSPDSGLDWGAVGAFNYDSLRYAGRRIGEVTTAVTGSFGTARLLQTSLLNALIFPDGRVFAGFVSPSTLEAVAASGSH